tara:strand:- start:376 stop:762 length:387 start_codon:yes stop_codon:yes gene_type:complete
MEHSKTPNYKMIPGSREKDTPGTFRDTPVNKYMEAPANMGHETVANMGHSPMDKHEPGHKETDAERRDRLSIGKAGTGMQASAGQRKGKIGGVTIKGNVGKQRGATDLAVEIPKAIKKAKDKIKSYFN